MVLKIDSLVQKRWGPPDSSTSELIRRYWVATRMEKHWEYLRAQDPKQFKKYLEKGYMEPIPVSILWFEASGIVEKNLCSTSQNRRSTQQKYFRRKNANR